MPGLLLSENSAVRSAIARVLSQPFQRNCLRRFGGGLTAISAVGKAAALRPSTHTSLRPFLPALTGPGGAGIMD